MISSDLKLAVWDLDGTIIDSYGVFAEVVSEAARLSGLPEPTAEVIKQNFHGSLEESIRGVLQLVDDTVADIVMNDFLRLQENYYREPDEHLYADALNLAEWLHKKGIKQVLATNRAHEGRGTASPRYLIQHTDMRKYIETIVAGDETLTRKPDARVLSGVAEAHGLRGDQMLVIGDQFVDAQLAHNLGAPAIIVSRANETVPHLDTLERNDHVTVVASLDDVIDK